MERISEARGVKDNFDNWNNFYDLKRVRAPGGEKSLGDSCKRKLNMSAKIGWIDFHHRCLFAIYIWVF